jgi:hypothetical protein
MKNNKGYYSWIHSLNQAAMQSQQNGFRMINEANEAKAKKITDPAKKDAIRGQLSTTPAKKLGSHIDDVYMGSKGAPMITDPVHAREVAGADEKVYDELRAAQIRNEISNPTPASISSGKHRSVRSEFGVEGPHSGTEEVPYGKLPYFAWAHDTKPIDVDGDGDADAKDVELDASDNVIGNESPEESPEDKYERDEEARHWSDYSGRTGEVHESLSQKINRILKD